MTSVPEKVSVWAPHSWSVLVCLLVSLSPGFIFSCYSSDLGDLWFQRVFGTVVFVVPSDFDSLTHYPSFGSRNLHHATLRFSVRKLVSIG
jgi:hypothetical protein